MQNFAIVFIYSVFFYKKLLKGNFFALFIHQLIPHLNYIFLEERCLQTLLEK